MAFLTVTELETHIYGENSAVISRGEASIPQAAVDGAIAEAKSYLKKYDTASVFGATGSNRNALLLIFVKDIAVWHYIQLANPGIDIELREKRYNAAIAWLKGVQKGDISPDLPDADDDEHASGTIQFGSNPKKVQHF
jgi:phage gp36-like protein